MDWGLGQTLVQGPVDTAENPAPVPTATGPSTFPVLASGPVDTAENPAAVPVVYAAAGSAASASWLTEEFLGFPVWGWGLGAIVLYFFMGKK